MTMHRRRVALACAALVCAPLAPTALAIDNGLGIVPSRGWRSWNEFGDDINQATVEAQMEALASRRRTVGGKPTSLADLGFRDAGIDDGWQMCNSHGQGFHNASGYPIVNESRFPDLRAMTAKAAELGLTAGWCKLVRARLPIAHSALPPHRLAPATWRLLTVSVRRRQQLHMPRPSERMPVSGGQGRRPVLPR